MVGAQQLYKRPCLLGTLFSEATSNSHWKGVGYMQPHFESVALEIQHTSYQNPQPSSLH